MRLKLCRMWFTELSTIGELYIDDTFFGFTLEDAVREEKIYGKTAIPYGTYKISITYSPRFQKYMPLLEDVPNFSGVRIHAGNTSQDTEGCVLVGKSRGYDFIGSSRKAFAELMDKLKNQKDITIEIVKGE